MSWSNWAGTATASPRRVVTPSSAGEVADLVRRAAEAGERVRMVGSGHSFTAAAATDGWQLRPDALTGVRSVDRQAMTVTVGAGTLLGDLNEWLHESGLGLHNMGDIDRQTVAGATATGTHGSGGHRASLSAQVCALEVVTGDGVVREVDEARDPGLFRATQVGLGALGVVTAVTLQVEPAFTLEADERPMRWTEVLDRYEELVAGAHHVDMYWFPHTDVARVKRNSRTVDDPEPMPAARRWLEDRFLANTVYGRLVRLGELAPPLVPSLNRLAVAAWGTRRFSDASHRVFVSPRQVVFKEMEYAVPREAGMAALAEVRRVIEANRWRVGFPVEVRSAPSDEAWLSTSYARDTVHLAFHVPARTDHRGYFRTVEQVLWAHGGRPHWGKLHSRTAAQLAGRYPRWEDFARVRDRVDPDRRFANPYLDRVLGP